MKTYTYFAIRRKSTGTYLPHFPIGQRYGQTHVSMEGDLQYAPPRLFPTKKGANVALKLWLKGGYGKVKAVEWKDDFDLAGNLKGRRRVIRKHVDFNQANSRMHLTDDMEVVEVRLEIVQSLDRKPVCFVEDDDI